MFATDYIVIAAASILVTMVLVVFLCILFFIFGAEEQINTATFYVILAPFSFAAIIRVVSRIYKE